MLAVIIFILPGLCRPWCLDIVWVPTKWVGVHVVQVDYGFEHCRSGLSKIAEAT
jgi:hypothetical protein